MCAVLQTKKFLLENAGEFGVQKLLSKMAVYGVLQQNYLATLPGS